MKLLAGVALLRAVAAGESNPVRRVVDLLSGLRDKCEKDLKAEEGLFEAYECWYKTIKKEKGASNEEAQSRIDSLSTYIEDIEAGRIEFTSERKDLEKEISGLKSDLSKATALREQEEKDFTAADEEMGTAIDALDEAITVLKEGTGEEFLQADTRKSQNIKWSLRKALQVGRALISKEDAQYMEAILDDDKPNPDWKKLNRKATFKMKYSARSKKIIATLESMKETFEKNKEAAAEKEDAAVKEYDDLKSAKEDLLNAAEKALTDMTKEGGARQLSKDDAQKEIDALESQVTADEKYMEEAESAYETKSDEWKARKELRQNEIVAFGKALEVLHSDDARDLFKKSYESQGYSFLQRSASVSAQCHRVRQVRGQALRELSSAVHDPRVALLATVADVSGIDKVVESIDKLVATLEDEEEEDLKNKENCESDLSNNYGDARISAMKVDDSTEDIDRAKSKVEEIAQQIKERQEVVAQLEKDLQAAKDQRAEEKSKFESDKVDDEKAKELIKMAEDVLKKWKTKGEFVQLNSQPMFLQVAAHKQHAPGDAPPPPPQTWDAGAEYKGAEGESQGVMSILSIIADDIQKDIDAAVQAEKDAEDSFEKIKTDLEDTIKDGEDAIDAYEKEKADREDEAVEAGKERATEKEGLDSIMDEIKSLKPGCNYILLNVEVRTKKRQVEIDGLKKAKAILQGADYGKESLLQRDAVSC
jgi:chromosome segregation ATPase